MVYYEMMEKHTIRELVEAAGNTGTMRFCGIWWMVRSPI